MEIFEKKDFRFRDFFVGDAVAFDKIGFEAAREDSDEESFG